jgi:hypothetical protein
MTAPCACVDRCAEPISKALRSITSLQASAFGSSRATRSIQSDIRTICRPVFTIHNLNYGADLIGRAMQACAVSTTVSPTYAQEISGTPAVAPNLGKMFGVRNGIDMDIWDPSGDRFLPVPFDHTNFDEGKVWLRSARATSLSVNARASSLYVNAAH